MPRILLVGIDPNTTAGKEGKCFGKGACVVNNMHICMYMEVLWRGGYFHTFLPLSLRFFLFLSFSFSFSPPLSLSRRKKGTEGKRERRREIAYPRASPATRPRGVASSPRTREAVAAADVAHLVRSHARVHVLQASLGLRVGTSK